MRSSIRLAVPAVAAAMLLLSACGGDDEDGEGGGSLGQGGQEQDGGDTGGDETGGEEAAGGDAGGAAPTAEELEGFWATGLEEADAVLTFTSGTVTFVENTLSDMSGASCFGTVADDTISLECDNGSTDFSEATLALNGSDLNVTWASGTTETYQSLGDMAGLEDMPDLGDLGGLDEDLAELEELQRELEELGL
ncbi:hypothetical protein [Streptomyces profundus]|uniref:hypothetical protein n=1 Tax=Streptomyces profundus TaxID=2867410 RepID=UPI001D160D5A|nr:hypothetical protein [Streptomyces sp. MA3_2.13]UED84759.1 hypothetical protein K4G22_11540 [Streptomyces sp. MA3_2.13]